jgi:DNA-binding response OmpR family regulator
MPAEPAPARDLQVLILEPDEKVAIEILSALEEAVPGTKARVAQSLGDAQRLVVDQKPALFVLDVDATYDMGQEFIYDLRTSHSNSRAIILTAIHFNAQRDQVSGLGAIHFLEKPFPRADFITLVEASLAPTEEAGSTRFQGTLSDLHVADIIQLKCISGATSMLEFTGPRGEKGRVYFENGQVRHATAAGKEGMDAFNEIVDWKGGLISEIPVPHGTPHTIHLDWQVLLMEAVRKSDELRAEASERPSALLPRARGHKVLVIDDSVMLLSFVKEILDEQGYEVITAEDGGTGLQFCNSESPDLILLDFVLPDMKGDEVCRRLAASEEKVKIPVVYVSGFGADLQASPSELPNVVGFLNKPFTSEMLLGAVRKYLGEPEPEDSVSRPQPSRAAATPQELPPAVSTPVASDPSSASNGWHPKEGSSLPPPSSTEERNSRTQIVEPVSSADSAKMEAGPAREEKDSTKTVETYFCGDSSFFSLHWALQTIARERLTGTLHAFWSRDSVDLLAREGQVVIVTTRNPELYCEEAPVTLANVPRERVDLARNQQTENGCPIFLTLVNEGLILREPGLQLVAHHGQKLFSRLWTERVRFTFVQHELPDYALELPASDGDMDQWALSTLRFVQYGELGEGMAADASTIPAYTRDGYDRVQRFRLTVAEAQFASQFNGNRSIAQISKNLRLDIKFARLTLFRFLALEIVECWPANLATRPEPRGVLRGLFSR